MDIHLKILKTYDRKDYELSGRRYTRKCSRGIIVNSHYEYAMLYSSKYKFYSFPGGSIEGNETLLEALIREIKEETGLIVNPESILEYGLVVEIRRDIKVKNGIYEKHDYYFTCDVGNDISELNMTKEEIESQYKLEYIDLNNAIQINKSQSLIEQKYMEAETFIMELIVKEKHEKKK